MSDDPLLKMTRTEDGLFQLRSHEGLDPRLFNKDLAPTRLDERTWTTYDIAALWVGLAVCIPTYMLAAGLIEGGMSWWQAILTITARQPDRSRSDGPERARGDAIRHPVPGAGARLLRQCEAPTCRLSCAACRRLRLVRHPDLDRRRRRSSACSRPRSRPGRRFPVGPALCFAVFWL